MIVRKGEYAILCATHTQSFRFWRLRRGVKEFVGESWTLLSIGTGNDQKWLKIIVWLPLGIILGLGVDLRGIDKAAGTVSITDWPLIGGIPTDSPAIRYSNFWIRLDKTGFRCGNHSSRAEISNLAKSGSVRPSLLNLDSTGQDRILYTYFQRPPRFPRSSQHSRC